MATDAAQVREAASCRQSCQGKSSIFSLCWWAEPLWLNLLYAGGKHKEAVPDIIMRGLH